MNILLLGKDGQIGRELRRSLSPIGKLTAWGRSDTDLSDLSKLSSALQGLQPDMLINAAAYTAVDRAESESESARVVNAESVGVLARYAKKINAMLVHYSTDYVFDGCGNGKFRETDATGPLNVYGRTKLEGEKEILASGCRHLIFRTSWVFSVHGANFPKTMLRLAAERDALEVVADQVGAPTSAELIADVTSLVLYRLKTNQKIADSVSGLYHLAAAGETSWHGFACMLLAEAMAQDMKLKAMPDAVRPILTKDYKTAALRPLNSRLDCSKLESAFELDLPDWRLHAKRLVWQLKPTGKHET